MQLHNHDEFWEFVNKIGWNANSNATEVKVQIMKMLSPSNAEKYIENLQHLQKIDNTPKLGLLVAMPKEDDYYFIATTPHEENIE